MVSLVMICAGLFSVEALRRLANSGGRVLSKVDGKCRRNPLIVVCLLTWR
jgi:hypothetical protein